MFILQATIFSLPQRWLVSMVTKNSLIHSRAISKNLSDCFKSPFNFYWTALNTQGYILLHVLSVQYNRATSWLQCLDSTSSPKLFFA